MDRCLSSFAAHITWKNRNIGTYTCLACLIASASSLHSDAIPSQDSTFCKASKVVTSVPYGRICNVIMGSHSAFCNELGYHWRIPHARDKPLAVASPRRRLDSPLDDLKCTASDRWLHLTEYPSSYTRTKFTISLLRKDRARNYDLGSLKHHLFAQNQMASWPAIVLCWVQVNFSRVGSVRRRNC